MNAMNKLLTNYSTSANASSSNRNQYASSEQELLSSFIICKHLEIDSIYNH